MRQAKKLGVLGLAVVALVAALGIMAGRGAPTASAAGATTVAAVTGPCTQLTTTTLQCSFTTDVAVAPGGTLVKTVTTPAVTIASTNVVTCTLPVVFPATTITLTCATGLAQGTTITEVFNVPAGTTAVSENVTYNANGPLTIGATTTTGACQVTPLNTGGGPAGNTFACQNANSVQAVSSGNTLTLSINCTTLPFCQYNSGAPTITPAVIGTCPLTSPVGPVVNGGTQVFTYTCGAGQSVPAGTVVTIGGLFCPTAAACTPATSVVSPLGAPFEVTVANANITVPTTIPGPSSFTYNFSILGAGGANQPTDENKFCTNTATNGNLNQVIGASNQNLAVSGPAKNFTLPLFGGASTCLIQILKGGVICSAANPCADGNIIVTLTTLGSGAAISCASSGLPAGQVLPALGVNGGACQQQALSTQLNIPCGVTAGTAQANTVVSNTCTNVEFDIQAALGACINSPTSACPNPGSGFNGGSATVTVEFLATPANGGGVGGIQLGTNTFTFQAPGIGTLLVTATPQLIPSNGTLASVVTATFACGSGFSLINGFPLSSNGVLAANANQPILGFSGLSGQFAGCGDGLPGTFNFTTPGNAIFDNGRSSESVSCGLTGQQNVFGGSNFFNPNGFSATAPLVFTCSGAAVLVIGAGAAGDAPINVTYTSAVGGLTAIGSTLITVSPSGVPRISVACNPSTIAAGNTGSLCTATVTDQNGVPLTGVTGATVTFTVSDTTVATILPCTVSVAGAINITTSPNVIPQIVPNTPCQTPTGQIPGQENTFINGQATALLVASNYAHPETVTVSASLGVLIPPSFACLTTPFTPLTLNQAVFGSGVVNGNGLVGNNAGITGCGLGNPVGFTGLASGFSVSGSGGLTGIVTLPNTTSASTTVNIGGVAGILIAGATTTSPLQLARGCNQVIVTSTNGTPIANIAALVSPTSAVVSIWRFNNGTKQFQAGFFSDPAAPTDFIGTGLSGAGLQGSATINSGSIAAGTQITESYFLCVNQSATIVSG